MEIKLDTETVNQLIGESIMTSLTQEKRDALIQGAIEYLLAKKKDPYSSREESPIELAFNSAIRNIADAVAAESLAKDTRVREVIHKMISEAVERMLDDKNYNNVVQIRYAITSSLSK